MSMTSQSGKQNNEANSLQNDNTGKKQKTQKKTQIKKFDLSKHFALFIFFLVISIVVNKIYFYLYFSNNLTRQDFKARLKSLASLDHIAFPPMIEHNAELRKPPSYLIQDDLIDDAYKQLDYEKEDDLKINDKKREAQMAISLAIQMQNEGKSDRAAKIYNYALSLDPDNTEALTHYGEYLEHHKKDIIKAEHFYSRALTKEPSNNKALANLRRTLPLVNKIDRIMLDQIDSLLEKFFQIPVSNSALKRAKREAYFMHIYHSNAIEGNTLNLQQTRHIVENRMAINGKSLLEHQEVLGLDAALRYINETLLYRRVGEFTLNDVLDIHRRVLGFTDPIESGKLREHQVYVGDFVPPGASLVKPLMNEFIEWLNDIMLSADQSIHPIQIAALAHYKFVYIHPFYDGNGRTARLLMNLILMKSGYPPIIIKKEERLEYYEYLEQANQGDVKPFIRFIAKCTERTLEEYIRVCNNTAFGISTGNSEETQMISSNVNVNRYLSNLKFKTSTNSRHKHIRKKYSVKLNFYDWINQFVCKK